MLKILRLVGILMLVAAMMPVNTVSAQAPAHIPVVFPDTPTFGCTTILWDLNPLTGEYYRQDMYCEPPGWNHQMVVYAHGYVDVTQPIQIPQDQLVFADGTSVPELITGLGFAFATSSYHENGLAVLTGLQDLKDLVAFIKADPGPDPFFPMGLGKQIDLTLLVGPSEGGLITALGMERATDVFAGGLSMCGPIGNFQKQIDYWGDFRVVFDYFFKKPDGSLFIPNPGASSHNIVVPAEYVDQNRWDNELSLQIASALAAKPSATAQLFRVTHAPYDLNDPDGKIKSALNILWYDVFANNDGAARLSGQPFNNIGRWYIGSSNDIALNRNVLRVKSTADAAKLKAFQTTGYLRGPLVTVHTIGDEVVPYWHEMLYGKKVMLARSTKNYVHIPVLKNGHCNFSSADAMVGFSLLYYKVTGQLPTGLVDLLPAESAAEYQELMTKEVVPLMEPTK